MLQRYPGGDRGVSAEVRGQPWVLAGRAGGGPEGHQVLLLVPFSSIVV